MPPTMFPNRHFSPPADNLDWGGWGEQSNQKQSKMMTPEEFVSQKWPFKNVPTKSVVADKIYQLMQAFADHCIEHRLDEDGEDGEDIQCDCGRMADREFYDTYGQCEFCESVNAEVERRVESQWISVDERLPEIDKDVLCAHRRIVGDVHIGHIESGEESIVSGKVIFWIADYDSIQATHWRPLPQPPKQ